MINLEMLFSFVSLLKSFSLQRVLRLRVGFDCSLPAGSYFQLSIVQANQGRSLPLRQY